MSKVLKFLARATAALMTGGMSEIIPFAVDVVGDALTGRNNLKAQREANETNIQLARENNQFNLDMWNRQNAYNTPLMQKERLIEAGLNPALQNVSTGVATSQVTGTPVTVDPVMRDNGTILDAMKFLVQLPLLKSQADSMKLDNQRRKIDNFYQEAEILKRLKGMDLDISGKELDNAGKELLNRFNNDTYEFRVDSMKEELHQRTLQNDLLSKQVKFLPTQQQMEVKRFVSDLSTAAVQRNLSKQQIANLAVESGRLKKLIDSLDIDNEQKRKMMQNIIDASYWNVILTRNNSSKAYWDTEHSKNNSGTSGFWQLQDQLGRKVDEHGGFFKYLFDESFK